MTIFRIFNIFTLSILIASCQFDEPTLVIEPTETVIESVGQEFVIRGTLDGEPFEILHENLESYNTPSNGQFIFSAHPSGSFGTNFILNTTENRNYFDSIFEFGIANDGSNDFEEIVKTGTYSWYNTFTGETADGKTAFLQHVQDNDQDKRLYSNPVPLEQNLVNSKAHFEITAVELLEVAQTSNSELIGDLYRVEGHFEVDIMPFGGPENGLPQTLKVDYFNAMFLDEN